MVWPPTALPKLSPRPSWASSEGPCQPGLTGAVGVPGVVSRWRWRSSGLSGLSYQLVPRGVPQGRQAGHLPGPISTPTVSGPPGHGPRRSSSTPQQPCKTRCGQHGTRACAALSGPPDNSGPRAGLPCGWGVLGGRPGHQPRPCEPAAAPPARRAPLLQDLGALKIPDQYRMTIWRGLQDLKQGHDCGQQLLRSSSNAATISIGSSGELQRQRVMEAVHFRVRHTITIPNRGGPGAAGPDEWADFGFDLPDCRSRKPPIKEEFTDSESH